MAIQKHLASKSRGSKALDEVEEDGEAAQLRHAGHPSVLLWPPFLTASLLPILMPSIAEQLQGWDPLDPSFIRAWEGHKDPAA